MRTLETSGQQRVKLRVRVIPGATQDEFAGVRDGVLVVHLHARPLKGAANKALSKFLSKTLRLSPADICITAGHRSRHKTLHILGLDAAGLQESLRQAGAL